MNLKFQIKLDGIVSVAMPSAHGHFKLSQRTLSRV
jgi:hypothetical protein